MLTVLSRLVLGWGSPASASAEANATGAATVEPAAPDACATANAIDSVSPDLTYLGSCEGHSKWTQWKICRKGETSF